MPRPNAFSTRMPCTDSSTAVARSPAWSWLQPRQRGVLPLEPPAGPPERQRADEEDEPEHPVHRHQDADADDDDHDVHDEQHEAEREPAADEAEVAHGAREQLAARPAVVEAHRQVLQLRVEGVAHARLDLACPARARTSAAARYMHRLDDAEREHEQRRAARSPPRRRRRAGRRRSGLQHLRDGSAMSWATSAAAMLPANAGIAGPAYSRRRQSARRVPTRGVGSVVTSGCCGWTDSDKSGAPQGDADRSRASMNGGNDGEGGRGTRRSAVVGDRGRRPRGRRRQGPENVQARACGRGGRYRKRPATGNAVRPAPSTATVRA